MPLWQQSPLPVFPFLLCYLLHFFFLSKHRVLCLQAPITFPVILFHPRTFNLVSAPFYSTEIKNRWTWSDQRFILPSTLPSTVVKIRCLWSIISIDKYIVNSPQHPQLFWSKSLMIISQPSFRASTYLFLFFLSAPFYIFYFFLESQNHQG